MINCFPGLRGLRICDLGGSKHFWEKVGLDVPEENITIYNMSKNETETISGDAYQGIVLRIFDGKTIPVEDNSFDLLTCNSVLEHVPKPQRASFVEEMRRVSKHVYCQTPAYSFPIDPHFIMPFIHWLPKTLGKYLLCFSPWKILSKPSKDTIDAYFHGTFLLREGELRKLFPDCEIYYERFLGMVKSYVVASSEGGEPVRVSREKSFARLLMNGKGRIHEAAESRGKL